jgi:hypothetical protein
VAEVAKMAHSDVIDAEAKDGIWSPLCPTHIVVVAVYAAELHTLTVVAAAPFHHLGFALDRRNIVVVIVVVAHGDDVGLLVDKTIIQSECSGCVRVSDYLYACF